MTSWKCRLTLVGSARAVADFCNSTGWSSTMAARYIDWLQLSPGRHVCQFVTDKAPVTQLQKISRRWTRLILLLDFEDEENRIKGLAKAKAGEIEHRKINY
jgi:hypothetical protein